MRSEKRQPTGKVSPTTAHCGSPNRQRTLPRSWMRPVRTNQRVAVGADRLGGLQQVLELGEVDVGVAVVDQRVEELQRVPDAHPPR